MITLQEAKPGSSYRVEGLTLPIDLERRLEALGLIEGSEIFVLRKKRQGAMIVKVRGTRFAVGYGISSHISVEKGGTGHGA
ncbi:FeoA family protein [Neglectibacter caecimuris]|uniref:FeoA family protein n=1 Tax=Neglectibacter caecimuris TaxID=3093658 RepID=UPI002AC98AC5|nr:FeoA family protein [Neglectibacter sp. M00184]